MGLRSAKLWVCVTAILLLLTVVAVTWTFRVREENKALRAELSQLKRASNQLIEEKTRNLESVGQPTASVRDSEAPGKELLRLRGEVGRLLKEDRESRKRTVEQMQVAREGLSRAEADVQRLTSLHAEKLVGSHELGRAQFALEILKAEAAGDQAGAARIRLQEAEWELARAIDLNRQKLLSESEYNRAKQLVELRRAESMNDPLEVERVKLRQAEEELARAGQLRSESLISESEYNAIVQKVDSLRRRVTP